RAPLMWAENSWDGCFLRTEPQSRTAPPTVSGGAKLSLPGNQEATNPPEAMAQPYTPAQYPPPPQNGIPAEFAAPHPLPAQDYTGQSRVPEHAMTLYTPTQTHSEPAGTDNSTPAIPARIWSEPDCSAYLTQSLLSCHRLHTSVYPHRCNDPTNPMSSRERGERRATPLLCVSSAVTGFPYPATGATVAYRGAHLRGRGRAVYNTFRTAPPPPPIPAYGAMHNCSSSILNQPLSVCSSVCLRSYGRVYATADPYHHTIGPAATYSVGTMVSV
uniref:RNA binding fox-1 homolog 3b n=1 Tax=Oryzias sinensis TaxID=183150 RepID=A0A8C7YRB2_9TELE